MFALALLGIFLAVIILGVPIGFSMGFLTIAAFTIGEGALVILPQKMFSGIYNFTYLCIPLFILASEIMSRCGLTMSIVKFCDTLVGHIRGGLAHVSGLLPVFPGQVPPVDEAPAGGASHPGDAGGQNPGAHSGLVGKTGIGTGHSGGGTPAPGGAGSRRNHTLKDVFMGWGPPQPIFCPFLNKL